MTTCFQRFLATLQLEDRISSGHPRFAKMPGSFCGSWAIGSNIHFEGYMVALGKKSKLVLNIAFLRNSKELCFLTNASTNNI